MRAAVAILALAVVASAAPYQEDLSGIWEFTGQCTSTNIFPYQFTTMRHCGNSVLIAPVDREYKLMSEMSMGTVANGVLTISPDLSGTSFTCTASGTDGVLTGSCAASGGPSCTFTSSCVDGMCLTGAAAPAQGAGAFPNADGTWMTTGGSCSTISGFSASFDLTQCGYSLLVVPGSESQGPNTGAISMAGHLMIGTQSGSTTQCEGALNMATNTVNATCYVNTVPACTIVLSR